ncbi:MAG: two-component system LytT family response regulator [Maribacter sp.]
MVSPLPLKVQINKLENHNMLIKYNTMKMKTLIVDNYPIHQIILGKMVESHPKLTLVAKVDNTLKAKKYLKDNPIELLFLDVKMPILNGFEFLDSLKQKPITILMTNRTDYAVKAFEYDIVYCLMQPITVISFQKSIKRVIARYRATHRLKKEEEYVLVKSDRIVRKVFLESIHWVEALGDYVRIVTDEGNFVTLSTMKCFANKLPNNRFLRIHKSYIVNLNKINKFNSRMVEIENTPLPLSRDKRNELDKALTV